MRVGRLTPRQSLHQLAMNRVIYFQESGIFGVQSTQRKGLSPLLFGHMPVLCKNGNEQVLLGSKADIILSRIIFHSGLLKKRSS